MTINWFSPLPPARTDIAHFTARLLPWLAQKMSVRLWTEQKEVDSALKEWAEVRTYSTETLDWAELNLSGPCFFNLGNDWRFHGSIWEAFRRHAGIVILHDASLQEFLACYHREVTGDAEAYLALMESAYGARGRRDGSLFWAGQVDVWTMMQEYPCTSIALETAIAAVVHSESLAANLNKAGACPVFQAGLPWPASGRPQPRKLGPPWQVVLFGYGGSNRRLQQIFSALSDLPADEPIRLDIYGEISNHARRLIGSAPALNSRVRIHGFVPEAELDRALSSSHLVLNLRYPTAGEASGSQLRAWSHGLPTVVCRTGWYASIPEAAVLFADPQNLVEDIQRHVRELQRNPEAYSATGMRGYDHLAARHSAAAYADLVMDIVHKIPELSRRAARLLVADGVGARMGGWLPEVLAPSCADSLASQIVKLLRD